MTQRALEKDTAARCAFSVFSIFVSSQSSTISTPHQRLFTDVVFQPRYRGDQKCPDIIDTSIRTGVLSDLSFAPLSLHPFVDRKDFSRDRRVRPQVIKLVGVTRAATATEGRWIFKCSVLSLCVRSWRSERFLLRLFGLLIPA